MESAQSSLRARLILGKFRVLERSEAEMKVALGGSTTMTVRLEPFMDVKAGDLITLYTEVFLAKPSQSSVE
jgi:hypothetical protein